MSALAVGMTAMATVGIVFTVLLALLQRSGLRTVDSPSDSTAL